MSVSLERDTKLLQGFGISGNDGEPSQEHNDDSSMRSQKNPEQRLKNCMIQQSERDWRKVPKRKSLHIKSRLTFAKKQDFWESILWTDETNFL